MKIIESKLLWIASEELEVNHSEEAIFPKENRNPIIKQQSESKVEQKMKDESSQNGVVKEIEVIGIKKASLLAQMLYIWVWIDLLVIQVGKCTILKVNYLWREGIWISGVITLKNSQNILYESPFLQLQLVNHLKEILRVLCKGLVVIVV